MALYTFRAFQLVSQTRFFSFSPKLFQLEFQTSSFKEKAWETIFFRKKEFYPAVRMV